MYAVIFLLWLNIHLLDNKLHKQLGLITDISSRDNDSIGSFVDYFLVRIYSCKDIFVQDCIPSVAIKYINAGGRNVFECIMEE